jgi:hypothetical protein
LAGQEERLYRADEMDAIATDLALRGKYWCELSIFNGQRSPILNHRRGGIGGGMRFTASFFIGLPPIG